MLRKYLFMFSLLIFASALLAACGATPAAPGANSNKSQSQNAVAPNTTGGSNSTALMSNAQGAAQQNLGANTSFESQTVEGGSVAVTVTPTAFKVAAPLEFDIAMNTHSVDLADDMLKAVVLRDDGGKEYAPTTWDGPAGGGHHREGKIKFAPLTTNTKTLTLVVKNIAGVPERVYQWNLAQ